MTAVHAFHPAENDDPIPTTADLLKRLRDQAETTRREPDRIVDSILGALDEDTCPQCGWPTTAGVVAVSCSHCLWWWEL